MRMDEMVVYLEREGFRVDKRYNSVRREYTFTIMKDDIFYEGVFIYPDITDYHEIDRRQRAFIDKLIREYEKYADYVRNDVSTTRDLLERQFNVPRKIPDIKKVIFNPPATVVLWKDGTKTVVKAQDEDFDPEKGLAMAISKKALGNQGNYCNEIKKWTDKYEPVEKEDDSITGLYNAQEFTFTLAPNSVCVSKLNNLTGEHSKKSINFVADVIGSEPEEPRSEALDE